LGSWRSDKFASPGWRQPYTYNSIGGDRSAAIDLASENERGELQQSRPFELVKRASTATTCLATPEPAAKRWKALT
jgi:hypothetical protein